MISIREEITIAAPPETVWPILSDPAAVAACIPGATLTKSDDTGAYQGTMRVKFGPAVAQFRGEAKLAYDHAARRCKVEGRGIDGRGASRANATGLIEAAGSDTTLLKVEGNFTMSPGHWKPLPMRAASTSLAPFSPSLQKTSRS